MSRRTFFAFDNNAMLIDGDPTTPIVNNSAMPNGTVFSFVGGGGGEVTVRDRRGGGSDPDIFEDDLPSRHIIRDGNGLVANGTQVEAESLVEIRALDAFGDPTGPVITLTVFSQGGVTGDVWGFSSDTALVSGTQYEKTGGSNTGDTAYSDFVACFGRGTLIRTLSEDVPIENVAKGDLIWTSAGGAKPVRWIGRTVVAADGALAPILFKTGAIGNNRDLLVSPNHRMLVEGWQVEMLFGEGSVLVPAKHLVGLLGVSVSRSTTCEYFHIMFDRHEIIEANGVLSESFYPGPVALTGASQNTRQELLEIFPELTGASLDYGDLAVPSLSRRESLVLTEVLGAVT